MTTQPQLGGQATTKFLLICSKIIYSLYYEVSYLIIK